MVPKGLAEKFAAYGFAASLVMTGVANVWGQEKPVAALGRVAALGEISEAEKRIILNRTETFLSRRYELVSQIDYEAAEEEAFAQLDADECTQEACIRKIQEILQVERMFILQIIREGTFTQLSLSLFKLDSRRIEEAVCERCTINDLHARVQVLADRLIGEDLGGVAVAVPVPAPDPVPAPPLGGAATLLLVGLTPEHRFQLDGTPMTPDERGTLAVDPGPHTVRISREGFLTREVTSQAVAGKVTRLDVELAPVTGYLTVTGSPEGATIAIEGGRYVPTEVEEPLPFSLKALPIGEYTLYLAADRDKAKTQDVTINQDEESLVNVDFRTISAELADEERTSWRQKWVLYLIGGVAGLRFGYSEAQVANTHQNKRDKHKLRANSCDFRNTRTQAECQTTSKEKVKKQNERKSLHEAQSNLGYLVGGGLLVTALLIYNNPRRWLEPSPQPVIGLPSLISSFHCATPPQTQFAGEVARSIG